MWPTELTLFADISGEQSDGYPLRLRYIFTCMNDWISNEEKDEWQAPFREIESHIRSYWESRWVVNLSVIVSDCPYEYQGELKDMLELPDNQ